MTPIKQGSKHDKPIQQTVHLADRFTVHSCISETSLLIQFVSESAVWINVAYQND